MSNNVFVNLGLPVLNGAGTAVDVSTMGPLKTIVINGDFPGCTIEIQASQVAGGASGFAPVCSFTDGDTHKVVDVAARYLRTFVRNREVGGTFTANVDVGAPEWINNYVSITMPVADGDGADVDVSALGSFWTVNMTGAFAGARITLMISEDGTAWSPLMSFTGPGQQSVKVSARFAHVNVLGFSSAFAATCQIGAADDGAPMPVAITSNCFVYKPGSAEAGPVVWDDFDALYAALDALRTENGGGCYSIEVDDSTTTPAVMGTAVAYNMTGVAWVGARATNRRADVSLPDGASYAGLRHFSNLIVTNLNTTTSPITDVVNGDQFVLDNTVLQTTTGGTIAAVGYTLTTGQAVTFWLRRGASLGGSETGRVIRAGNGAGQTHVQLDASSSIAVPAALSNGGFALPVLVVSAPSTVQVPNFPNWTLGSTSPGPAVLTPASLLPIPFLGSPSNAAVTPVHGSHLRINALASGGITQTLPPISTAADGFGAPGVCLVVENTAPPGAGNSTLTLVPDTGDTIQGQASWRLAPGQAITLISDGVSDWRPIGAYQPIPQILRSPGYLSGTMSTQIANDAARISHLGFACRDYAAGEAFALSCELGTGVDVTWGEIALAKGPLVSGNEPAVRVVGYVSAVTEMSAAFNKPANLLVTTTVPIRAGDGLWAITAAANTNTDPQIGADRADSANAGVAGVLTTPGWRPSEHVDEDTTFTLDRFLVITRTAWTPTTGV